MESPIQQPLSRMGGRAFLPAFAARNGRAPRVSVRTDGSITHATHSDYCLRSTIIRIPPELSSKVPKSSGTIKMALP